MGLIVDVSGGVWGSGLRILHTPLTKNKVEKKMERGNSGYIGVVLKSIIITFSTGIWVYCALSNGEPYDHHITLIGFLFYGLGRV